MSFAFQFDESEVDPDYLQHPLDDASSSSGHAAAAAAAATLESKSTLQAPFREWTLASLLDTLPSRISYSPLHVPLDPRNGQQRQATLMRRDLFDARFQMLLDEEDQEQQRTSQDDGATESEEAQQDRENQAVAGVASDLVPGVYEGGLKTWECSLDLVATLNQQLEGGGDRSDGDGEGKGTRSHLLHGKSILDLGCGTGVPSLYLLQHLLNDPSTSNAPHDTVLHLCDYNSQVLRLVTLPNLILTWYFSSAAHGYRTSAQTLQARQQESEQLKKRGQDHFDLAPSSSAAEAEAGELSLDEPLLDAFQQSLRERRIALRFFSGSWQGLQAQPILAANLTSSSAPIPTDATTVATEGYFDVILTAETIYSLETLPLLVDVLRRCCRPSQPIGGVGALDERLRRCSLAQPGAATTMATTTTAPSDNAGEERGARTLCLVGAKVLYFGVGGGVEAFKQLIQSGTTKRGWTETIRTISKGVGRVVLSVGILPE
ncbi:hypothetical protein ACQY0O_007347 [Thecaphora frezii]